MNSLKKKMLQLRESGFVNQRFYHLQSTANFIAFIDKLKSKSERERVYHLLNNYLDLVQQEPVENAAMSMDLFNEFIRPVGRIYEVEFDFMPMINLWVIFFWIIICFSILYILNLSIIFYCIVGVLLIVYYIYVLKKRIDKKVYGYTY